jgi:hypothetical protein
MTRIPDAEAEIRDLQSHSTQLASQSAEGLPPARPLHDTTTVAVRLIRKDADAIAALADEQGVPVSTLLRMWILAGLKDEQGDTVGATLSELERGLQRLRQALG